MNENIIEIKHLRKSFGTKVVLKDVNLNVPKGSTVVILGLSGQGKSTIIKHIVSLLKPDSGEIIVDGIDVAKADEKGIYETRKKIGFLFQEGAMFDSMSVYDNVAFPLREHTKLSEEEIREKVFEKLDMVGFDSERVAKLYPFELSGGMRKRAATARAIILEPKIILYDEPTSGLDPIISDLISQMTMMLQEKLGVTSIVISHDLKESFKIADYVGMLYNGEIIEFAPPKEFQKSENKIVQAFLKGDSSAFDI
jgi:phospholipid/cholesterol/gamma-HCH transport system ATP-binding protein